MYRKLIRDNNIFWSALYYDELHNYDNFQISYFLAGDFNYYNCAHVINSLSADDFEIIEDYFKSKNKSSCIYTHDDKDIKLISILKERGYKEKEDENENFWALKLNDKYISELKKQNFLKDPSLKLQVTTVKNDSELKSFIELNAITNSLTQDIKTNLYNNLSNKNKNKNKNNIKPINYLGKDINNDSYICCGNLGIVNETGCMAEDGVLEKYRRKGIHKHLYQQRIISSYLNNAKYVVVTCDKDAISNLTPKSLGFELACTRRLWIK